MNNVLKLLIDKVMEIGGLEEAPPHEGDLTLLGFDSMRLMHLIVELEIIFGISFEDDDLLLDNFKMVSRISGMVMKQLA